VALVALAALVVLVASIFLGRSQISPPAPVSDEERAAGDARPAPDGSPPPAGLVAFEDSENGFSILYPRSWKRLEAPDEEVRLLVARGDVLSLLVRVAPVGLTVTRDTLGEARGLTDSLIGSDSRVKLLSSPRAITLDGLPGYRYVYTYRSGPDGSRSAHVHYFVFKDKRLISLVFQVSPASALKRASDALDRIAGTFRAMD